MQLPMVSQPVDADNALILDCLAGNIHAFGVLVSRHRTGLYNFILHTVGTEADAQDIAQEAFLRAYAALPRFRRGSPFEPWIYRIAANLCISHFRRSKRRPESLDSEQLTRTLSAPSDMDPAMAIQQRDENRRLLAAVYALPVDQRMVIILRHLQERSYREIADVLDIPVSTVEHRLRAARNVLKQNLSDPETEAARSRIVGGAR